ncbi:hypothetical protein D3C80_1637930 [compost metagenome]
MGDGIVHHQQAARGKQAPYFGPPSLIVLAIGVQEDELITRRRQAGEQAAGLPRQLINPGFESGVLKVEGCHGPFTLVQLYGGDPAIQSLHRFRQPKGGVTV